jgi:hypothetical protein
MALHKQLIVGVVLFVLVSGSTTTGISEIVFTPLDPLDGPPLEPPLPSIELPEEIEPEENYEAIDNYIDYKLVPIYLDPGLYGPFGPLGGQLDFSVEPGSCVFGYDVMDEEYVYDLPNGVEGLEHTVSTYTQTGTTDNCNGDYVCDNLVGFAYTLYAPVQLPDDAVNAVIVDTTYDTETLSVECTMPPGVVGMT